MATEPFIPRGSKLGYYMTCLWRALLDLKVKEGTLTLDEVESDVSSPPADLGTMLHWMTQCKLRAQFMSIDNDTGYTGWDSARALIMQPTGSQQQNALRMFSSQSEAESAIDNISTELVQMIHNKFPNREWMAEVGVNLRASMRMTGHIDLLSSCFTNLIDIKTTGSKPVAGKIKPAHYWQQIGYALALSCLGINVKEIHILYAHNKGDWAGFSKPIKLDDPVSQLSMSMMQNLLSMLNDPDRLRCNALPSFGNHCDEQFCPYRSICRDAILPKGTRMADKPIAIAPTSSNPFGGTT